MEQPPRPPDRVSGPSGWAEQLVRLLDDGFRIPGTEIRFGLDPILGLLLPGVGDAAGALGTFSLFLLALRRGVPNVVLLRMALNVGLDALFGVVPVLGDLFDLGFKANRKNLALIEQNSAAPGTLTPARNLSHWLVVSAILFLVACALCLPLVLAGMLLRALWPD